MNQNYTLKQASVQYLSIHSCLFTVYLQIRQLVDWKLYAATLRLLRLCDSTKIILKYITEVIFNHDMECIYYDQIERYHRKVKEEFYGSMADVIKREPPTS